MKTCSDMNETRLGSDALTVCMGAGCILLLFYIQPFLQSSQLPGLLNIALILALISTLFFLRDRLGQIFRTGRPDFVTADASGVSFARNRDVPGQFRAWKSIDEIVLTRKFRIVYPNGKILYRHVVIVFLKPEHRDDMSSSDQYRSGISTSATGRLYLSSDFPDGNWHRFEAALRKFAPEDVAVKICAEAVFDRSRSTDCYT